LHDLPVFSGERDSFFHQSLLPTATSSPDSSLRTTTGAGCGREFALPARIEWGRVDRKWKDFGVVLLMVNGDA